MTAKAKKIIKITVDVILWAFLAFATLMTVLAFMANASGLNIPRVGNTCFLLVETDSMDGPEGFSAGDLIICKTLTDEQKTQLKNRDVITFVHDLDGDGTQELNSHRIFDSMTFPDGVLRYHTKGDNNTSADNYWVAASEVEAVWTGRKYPGLGKVVSYVQSDTGFPVCIVIPMALIFVYQLYVLLKAVLEMKGKKTAGISAEEEALIKQRAIEEYLAKKASEDAAQDKHDND